jgi:hypothetical protein
MIYVSIKELEPIDDINDVYGLSLHSYNETCLAVCHFHQ